MKHQEKTKEELIIELDQLHKAYDALRRSNNPDGKLVFDIGSLRKKAEDRVNAGPGKTISQFSETEALNLVHELQVHQLELELQNEELMRANEQVTLANKKFVELYDFAPSGYFSLSKEGNILELNLSGAKIIGNDRSALINKSFSFFVSNETKPEFDVFLTRIFNTKDKESCDVKLSTKDERPKYIHVSGIATENGEQCHLTVVDVTEQRFEKDSLQQSSLKWDAIISTSPDGIGMVSLDGKLLMMSDKLAVMHGYSVEEKNEYLGSSVFEFIDPVHHEILISNLHNLLAGKSNYRITEYLAVRKDQSRFNVELYSTMIRDSNGNPASILYFERDITERKRSEEILRESEEKYRSIFESMQDVYYEATIDGTILEISPSIEVISKGQYTRNELIGKSLVGFYEKQEDRNSFFSEIEKRGSVTDYELSLRNKDGSVVSIAISSTLMYDANGKPFKIAGSMRDITERKMAEENLRNSEERYRSIFQGSVDGIMITGKESKRIFYANSAQCKMLGYTEQELTSMTIAEIHPEDIFRYALEEFERLARGEKALAENIQVLKKDGEILYVDIVASFITINGIEHIVGFFRDVSGRKKGEDEIRKLNESLALTVDERTAQLALSNEHLKLEYEARSKAAKALEEALNRLHKIADRVPGVVYQYRLRPDGSSCFPYASEGICEIYRVSPEEIAEDASVVFTRIHPDDIAMVTETIQLSAKDLTIWKHEYRVKFEDGDVRWLSGNAAPQREADGTVLWHGFIKDITERKQAEEELEESQEKYRGLSEASFEAIFFSYKGLCIEQNLAAEKIFGYTSEEAITKYGTDWIVPEDREMVMKNMIAGIEEPYEATALRKDGTTFPCVLRGRMMHYKGRDVRVTSLNDITARKQAEEDLKQVSTRLKLAARAGGVGVWDYDPVGNNLVWDAQMFSLYGLEEKDFSGAYDAWQKGLHPDDRKRGDTEIRLAIEGEKEFDTEFRVVWPDGTIRNIRALAIVQRDDAGKPLHMIGTNWDITDEKKVETLLDQTRHNYETFFNTIDDFLFVLDEQGNMIHTNSTVTKRLEYSTPELFGKSVLMVHPAERREEAGRIVGEMLAGTADYCPVPLITKTGNYIPVETRVKTGLWDGKPVIFGVSKDISKIKLSEEKFSKAFHSNTALMAISGFDGTFIDVNISFLNKLGYEREEVIGISSMELQLFTDPLLRTSIIENLSQNIPVREIEVEVTRKDGSLMIGLFSAETIFIGQELCLLTIMIDITERKLAEAEIINARNEAEKANIAKSEFLSRMSHELRTPMNSILGFAQLMQMGQLNPGQKKGVNHILASGTHLLQLINEVLDISRIEAGRITLSLEPVQLSNVIREMIDVVQPLIVKRHLKAELLPSPDNQLFVKADCQRLKQVLLNLINNAVKYNREGGSVIVQTVLQEAFPDCIPTVRISISDMGPGISSEDLGKLFLPFERIGAERSETEGTGLGLTVVKKLMDAMGGTVGVESVPGEGSTFWIELPLAESQQIVNSTSNEALTPGLATTEKSATILYIEDNISNAELVEEILQNQRPAIRLITTISGKLAVKLAIDHSPDLILLDLDLPDMHGSNVLAKLKANSNTSDIPVVIISADVMPQQVEKLMMAGARDYLAKPIDIMSFLHMVDEWISGGSTKSRKKL